MKGNAWIIILAAAGGILWMTAAAKKKKEQKEAQALAQLAAQQTQTAPPPAPKKKKKKKAPTKPDPDLPSPGFSFGGEVIGNCLFSGGPGVIIEYPDGSTECVAAVDITAQ